MNLWMDRLPSLKPARRRVLAGMAIAGLLSLFAIETILPARDLSATWNEPYHILAGYSYWNSADYGVNPEHPPLAKLVGAFPLLFMHLKATRLGRDDSKPAANKLAWRFVYGNDAGAILFRARMAESLLGLLLVLLLFEAGYQMFGAAAAWIAAVLAVFEPNLLAHATLVTTDFAVACFYFAAVYAFWRVSRRPSMRRLTACGVMTGLAFASKHSAILLIPTLLLLATVEVACEVGIFDPDAPNPRPRLPRLLRIWTLRLGTIFGIALLVLWGFYGFHYEARPGGLPLWANPARFASLLHGHVEPWLLIKAERFKLLPQAYLFGLTDVLLVTAGPRMSFLLGRLHPHAVWYYFPTDFIIKSTLGFLGLLLLALFTLQRWSGEGHRRAAYLLIPPGLFMGVAMTAGTNLGIRHVLVIYPFLILAAAAGASSLARKRKAWAVVVTALMLAQAASSLHTMPDYLAYSNELFGGTSRTYRVLSNSDVDWGQGLIEAQRYLERRHIHDCWMAYIGTIDPAYYHLPCKMLPNPFIRAWDEPVPPSTFHGLVLVSATERNGDYLGAGVLNPYSGFQRLKPVANIGGSILAFEGDIDLRPAAAIVHLTKADELLRVNYPPGAIQEALKAEDLDPDHPGPPYIIGCALAREKRTEAARVQLENAVKLAQAAHPEFEPVWLKAAQFQLAALGK